MTSLHRLSVTQAPQRKKNLGGRQSNVSITNSTAAKRTGLLLALTMLRVTMASPITKQQRQQTKTKITTFFLESAAFVRPVACLQAVDVVVATKLVW